MKAIQIPDRKFISEHKAGGNTWIIWQYFNVIGQPYYRLQVDDIMVSPDFRTVDEAMALIRKFEE